MNTEAKAAPSLVFERKTKGQRHGPITRLISPGDLGESLKPFVFLDAVRMEPDGSMGFGWHPHSGIATVTNHFVGSSWAEESDGQRHLVPAGGLEYVHAGGGVWHRGGAAPGVSQMTGFQLWLALGEEQELLPAQSRYYEPERIPQQGAVRVLLGEYDGLRSPVKAPVHTDYLQIDLPAGERLTIGSQSVDKVAFVAIIGGKVEIRRGDGPPELLRNIELGQFLPSSQDLVIESQTDAQLVYGAAAPHRNSLALGHYSVHTSTAALEQGEAGIRRIYRENKTRLQDD
ncbi:MAG: pirin family protein [Gammaproteobacteria bacterium]|nr:pirin family protein [Gammaproteobacteria bacterium]MDH3416295.1 pirin family protein [Gammaproteobacteria bacterium]